MTTQEMCSGPPGSLTIAGIAELTTMLSSIDRSMASMTPSRTQRTFFGTAEGAAVLEEERDADMADHSFRTEQAKKGDGQCLAASLEKSTSVH
ncbi:hypothetical protein [Streptomyces sp. NPDC054865]